MNRPNIHPDDLHFARRVAEGEASKHPTDKAAVDHVYNILKKEPSHPKTRKDMTVPGAFMGGAAGLLAGIPLGMANRFVPKKYQSAVATIPVATAGLGALAGGISGYRHSKAMRGEEGDKEYERLLQAHARRTKDDKALRELAENFTMDYRRGPGLDKTAMHFFADEVSKLAEEDSEMLSTVLGSISSQASHLKDKIDSGLELPSWAEYKVYSAYDSVKGALAAAYPGDYESDEESEDEMGEYEKEASLYGLAQEIASNTDPTTIAALTAMAKVNLMNRYGSKIPIMKDVMGKHYTGMLHAGVKGALRGEAGPAELSKGIMAIADSNTPGLYDRGRQVGSMLRKAGVHEGNLHQSKDKILEIAGSVAANDPELSKSIKDVAESVTKDTKVNKLYDRMFSPIFKKKTPEALHSPEATARLDRFLNNSLYI